MRGYRSNDPYLSGMADDYITGGADPYGDELPGRCCACGGAIYRGGEYYDVNGEMYCLGCSEIADEAILAAVRESYIFEM